MAQKGFGRHSERFEEIQRISVFMNLSEGFDENSGKDPEISDLESLTCEC